MPDKKCKQKKLNKNEVFVSSFFCQAFFVRSLSGLIFLFQFLFCFMVLLCKTKATLFIFVLYQKILEIINNQSAFLISKGGMPLVGFEPTRISS